MTTAVAATGATRAPASPSIRRRMLAAVLCAYWSTSLVASDAGISPTSIELNPGRPVQTLSVSNPGKTVLAFELNVKRWAMDAEGKWLLEDVSGTTNLVVHPLNFRIPPGKVQLIRIGATRPEPGPQRAYRLLVRELPPDDGPGQTKNLIVLTQFSVPLFVSGQPSKPEPSVLPGTFRNGRWHYSLRAGAFGHLRPSRATLRLLDGTGHALSEQQISHGYVLAGASLPISAPVDRKTCLQASTFELSAPAPIGLLKGGLPAGARACEP